MHAILIRWLAYPLGDQPPASWRRFVVPLGGKLADQAGSSAQAFPHGGRPGGPSGGAAALSIAQQHPACAGGGGPAGPPPSAARANLVGLAALLGGHFPELGLALRSVVDALSNEGVFADDLAVIENSDTVPEDVLVVNSRR